MRLRDLAILTVVLLVAEAVGLPASGLVALAGMLAVALGGLLLAMSAEEAAGRSFALGLGLLAGAALLRAGGGALGTNPGTAPTGSDIPMTEILLGLGCLGCLIVVLTGLHLLARGLASLPDRPPPTMPREWRNAEVLRPDDRVRAPNVRNTRTDDLDLFRDEP